VRYERKQGKIEKNNKRCKRWWYECLPSCELRCFSVVARW